MVHTFSTPIPLLFSMYATSTIGCEVGMIGNGRQRQKGRNYFFEDNHVETPRGRQPSSIHQVENNQKKNNQVEKSRKKSRVPVPLYKK